MGVEDQQSSQSEKQQTRGSSKRSSSLEKIGKHMTWTTELDTYPELQDKRPQISAGPEPAWIKQYMNLTYNSKETQTDNTPTKSVVNS